MRAHIEELLREVLEGRIEPGRVFDRKASLEDVPDGYRAMNDREVIKVMIEPYLRATRSRRRTSRAALPEGDDERDMADKKMHSHHETSCQGSLR